MSLEFDTALSHCEHHKTDHISHQPVIEKCPCGHNLGRMIMSGDTIISHTLEGVVGWRDEPNDRIYDLNHIPLKDLILKSCGLKIRVEIQLALKSFLKERLQKAHFRQCPEPWDSLCLRYHKAVCKVESMFPTFFILGTKLYEQMRSTHIQELLTKHENCPIVSYHDPRYCDVSYSKCADIPESIRCQQILSVPDFKSWLSSESISNGKLLDKITIEYLRKLGLVKANAFVFRGFIPHKYACEIAKTAMFLDAADSPLIFHGPRTHLFQLCSFLSQNGLSVNDLQLIIKLNAWMLFFDSQAAKMPTFFDSNSQCYFHGLVQRLTGINPEGIHLLLLQKQLSTCVIQVLNKGTLEQKEELLTMFSIPKEQSNGNLDKDLAFVAKVLKVFEAYIINSYYKAFFKAGYKDLPVDNLECYKVDSIVTLCRESDHKKICAQLAKGYTVATVFIEVKGAEPEHKVFESVDDYELFYPKMRKYYSFGYITDKHLFSDDEASLRALLAKISQR